MNLIHHRLLGVLALTSLTAALACGGSNATGPGGDQSAAQRNALTQAESQWTAAGIHDYNYDFVRNQFGQHDSVQVQVRTDQVTLSKSYLTGQATAIGTAIPDLFSAIDDAISAGLTVGVTYDPQFGYPTHGSINPTVSTPAGGTSWTVVNFTRVP